MNDQIEMLKEQGKLTTVAEAIGDEARGEAAPNAFAAPRLAGYPSLPPEGIHFGMPEDAYHQAPALSASGILKLAASPLMFWAEAPWLSAEALIAKFPELAAKVAEENEEVAELLTLEPEPKGDEKDWAVVGKAYHARILEGPEAYRERFYVKPEKKDYPNLCETVEQIEAAIRNAGAEPVSRIETGEEKESRGKMVPVTRAAVKADKIAQLLDLDPDAQIWEHIVAKIEAANVGKAGLPYVVAKRIETAARMIEAHEELRHAVRNGHPEVSLFWTCPRTQVPMKARVDRLTLAMLVDLKSYENKTNSSPERAIEKAIAARRYFVQPVVYWEGAEQVKALVREHGAKAVHVHDAEPDALPFGERVQWALKWAAKPDPAWLWLFQQKGPAPITRGVLFSQGETLALVAKEIVAAMKRRYRKSAEAFGTDAWLDIVPVYDLASDNIPSWASEI